MQDNLNISLKIAKAPGAPEPNLASMSMQFPPQEENADKMQEEAFAEVVADEILDE